MTDLADAGYPIVLLMHSYGGIVGSNALKDLSLIERKRAGPPGGVVHLIYMVAFILPLNTCMNTPFDSQIPP